MSQKPARALYIPWGKEDWRPNKHRFPSDTRTITTGDIWRGTAETSQTSRPPADLGSCRVCYRGIVDYARAVANPLTSCRVALGRLACGAAEAVGLMPAQQSPTLKNKCGSEQTTYKGSFHSKAIGGSIQTDEVHIVQ